METLVEITNRKKVEMSKNIVRLRVMQYMCDNWTKLGDEIVSRLGDNETEEKHLANCSIAGTAMAEMFTAIERAR